MPQWNLVSQCVVDRSLPGAFFDGLAACKEFADERRAYEAAVEGYARGVDPANVRRCVKSARAAGYSFVSRASVREFAEWGLREQLAAIGYLDTEIRWHIENPGKRDRHSFVANLHH